MLYICRASQLGVVCDCFGSQVANGAQADASRLALQALSLASTWRDAPVRMLVPQRALSAAAESDVATTGDTATASRGGRPQHAAGQPVKQEDVQTTHSAAQRTKEQQAAAPAPYPDAYDASLVAGS